MGKVASAVSPPDDPIRVLIVDDHSMVAEGLRRLLTDAEGITVVGLATTAAGAVAAAGRHRPDVVVLDYQLPDDVGTGAAVRIADVAPDARVIMLTGSDDPGALAAAMAAGCVGYLEKTSAHTRLPAAIRAAAAGELVLSPQDFDRLRRHAPAPAAAGPLTARELEVLCLLAEGATSPEMAEALGLSVNTVRKHAQNVLEKLEAHTRLEAVSIARRAGLLD